MILKTHIIVHHSYRPKDSKLLDMQGIRLYHKSKGWRDGGYHAYIERVNNHYEIIQGRMFEDTGAHCYQQGMNKKAIGICMIGNFDIAPPPKSQWELAVRYVRSLMTIFDVSKEDVEPHRKYAPYKSCPGEMFDFDLFRSEL